MRVRTLALSPSVSVRIAAGVYAIVFSVAGVLDYVGFRSAGYDLGNAVQAIWNTAHGRLLYATWWLDEERWVLFGIAAVLAAASNEQIPLVVGCLGLWYGLTRKRPVVGVGLFAAGLGVTAFDFIYLIPHFSMSGTNPFAD